MNRARKWPIPINLALMASLLAPLLAWGYIGFFTRYWYDDFCYASVINKVGFLRSLAYEYRHWTGRYTLLILNAALAPFGPKSAPFVGVILLAAWLATATWAIYQLFSLMRWPSPLINSIMLAELIVYATLNSTPDIVASFYWQTGSLVYTLPLVLLMLYVGLLLTVVRSEVHLRLSSPWLIAGALLTFVAGGCSETYGAVQITGLSLLILVSLKYTSGSPKRTLLLMATSGLLGSLLSFSILALAPGNEVRQGFFAPHPHLLPAVKSSLSYSLSFVERHVRRSRGTSLLSLMFPMWLAFALHLHSPTGLSFTLISESNRKKVLHLFMLAPVGVFLLLVASIVPGFYVLSEAPPGRALFLPKFVLITSTVFLVFFGSLALFEKLKESPRIRNAVLVVSAVAVFVLAAISPLASARHTFGLRFKASEAAAAWDSVDQKIRRSRSQGSRALAVPAINVSEWQLGFGRADLLPVADPNAATNRCVADYYELDAITFK